jgi:hypothetical protein
VCDCGRCGSRRLEKDGFGVDSGSISSSGRDIASAWRMPGGNAIEEKVFSSWKERTIVGSCNCCFRDGKPYLERLGIPVLHFLDGWHSAKVVG